MAVQVPRRWWYIVFVIVATTAGCGVPGPCGNPDSFGLDLKLPNDRTERAAIVFVVDGVNAEIFDRMLTSGELPAIKKYFLDRGLYAPSATATIPSLTLVNLTSIATGRFAGHHGVTGNNWFDRRRRIWRDCETIAQKNMLDGDYTAETIFELFPDQFTCSIFYQAHRGATKFFENVLSAVAPFVFGCYEFVDRLTLYRFGEMAWLARGRKEWPVVTFCYLLAPDFQAYRWGVESPQYRDAIKHTDRQIGRVMGDLDKAGLLKKLIVVLTSDHGLAQVEKHFPLDEFIRNSMGLSPAPWHLWEDTALESRKNYYRRFSVVTYGGGRRYRAICLRKPIRATGGNCEKTFEPWPVRPDAEDIKSYPSGEKTIDIPAVLINQQAVDAVAYRSGANRVRVQFKDGLVEFHQSEGRGGLISYRLISGSHPPSWQAKVPAQALQGKAMTGRQWQRATNQTQFPDLAVQISAYFRSELSGDVVVFAAAGWDFKKNSNRAGHGGIRPADMHVPLLIAGPGISKFSKTGRLTPARTVDITPTLLKLLGKKTPKQMDGLPLTPSTSR